MVSKLTKDQQELSEKMYEASCLYWVLTNAEYSTLSGTTSETVDRLKSLLSEEMKEIREVLT